MPIQVRSVHGDLIRGIATSSDVDQSKKDALISTIIPAYDAYVAQFQAAAARRNSDDQFVDGAVAAINGYKDLIDGRNYTVTGPTRFIAQQKVHSTVMEEFWARMMGEILRRSSHTLAEQTTVYLGPGAALQNIIFAPKTLKNLLAGPSEADPWFQVRLKDRDCMMAVAVDLRLTTNRIEARIPTRSRGEDILPENERTRPLSDSHVYIPSALSATSCQSGGQAEQAFRRGRDFPLGHPRA